MKDVSELSVRFRSIGLQTQIIEFGKRMSKGLPLGQLAKMGLNFVFRPKTKSWGKTGEVLAEYVKAQKEAAHHG